MINKTTPAWIAQLTEREDIALLSLIPQDAHVTSEKRVVKLSTLVSGIFIVGPSKGFTLIVGVPEGSFWDAFSKVRFTKCEIVESSDLFESAWNFKLSYKQPFLTSKSSKTRHGIVKDLITVDLDCSFLIPCDDVFRNSLLEYSEVQFCPYDKHRHFTIVDSSIIPIIP